MNERQRIRRSHLVNEKGIFVHFVFNRKIVFSKLHIFFSKKKVNGVLLSSDIFHKSIIITYVCELRTYIIGGIKYDAIICCQNEKHSPSDGLEYKIMAQ